MEIATLQIIIAVLLAIIGILSNRQSRQWVIKSLKKFKAFLESEHQVMPGLKIQPAEVLIHSGPVIAAFATFFVFAALMICTTVIATLLVLEERFTSLTFLLLSSIGMVGCSFLYMAMKELINRK